MLSTKHYCFVSLIIFNQTLLICHTNYKVSIYFGLHISLRGDGERISITSYLQISAFFRFILIKALHSSFDHHQWNQFLWKHQGGCVLQVNKRLKLPSHVMLFPLGMYFVVFLKPDIKSAAQTFLLERKIQGHIRIQDYSSSC